MKKIIIAIMVLVLTLSGVALAQDVKVTGIERASDIPSFVGYVQNEFIIVFKQGVKITPDISSEGIAVIGVPDFDTICRKHAVSRIRKQFRGTQGGTSSLTRDLARYYKVKFDKGKLEETMAAYRHHPLVDHVEPIGIHTTHSNPNDYHFPYQWYLNSASYQDINASEAWDIETGSEDVIVAVLDTGVRYFHKDLGGSDASLSSSDQIHGNMWINSVEKNANAGIDDDGNGYIDDWIGWDFVAEIPDPDYCYPTEADVPGEDCSVPDNDPRDFNGHGTEMAGIIAANTNNGYSVAGIAGGWGNGTLQPGGNGVKIMACRIGWSELRGQSEIAYVRMDFAAEALHYAADNGARIANCSWYSSDSGGIDAAVEYFLASGGLIFKSAGNGGSETDDFLCNIEDVEDDDIICVAAINEFDCKAFFSGYGDCVDISAPGVSIMTTTNKHNDPENDYDGTGNSTSMATAVVAGVAALIWSRDTNRTASQVKQILYDSVDNIYSLTCNSSYAGKLGAGRVNAYNAVMKCLTSDDCDDSNMCTDDICNTNSMCTNDPICPEQQVCSRGECIEPNCNDDGTCAAGEDCNSCSGDCPSGTSGAECGNYVCETGKGEDCISCPDDCKGKLTGGPNYRYCCGDGTAAYGVTCTDGRCSGGGYSCTSDPGSTWCCGDGLCEGPEDGDNCGIDCGIDCDLMSDCDDGNDCTEDACIGSLFCQNKPVAENTPCTVGICCGGTCTTATCTSNTDCNDSESCTEDVCNNLDTCSASCTNTWPTCGPTDGCCGPSCTSANDPDCGGQDCTNCFKGKCDGECNLKKEDASCPDCASAS